jgi:hypothetical protein
MTTATRWHQSAEHIDSMIRQKAPHMDANESIFFARQLEWISGSLYDVKYPQLKARKHIPVSFEGGNAVESLTYQANDRLGVAKIVSNYSKDFPRVTTLSKEITNKVKTLGDSYGWDIQKIRAARFANRNLEAREANAARMAIMELENRLAYLGDASAQLNGLLTHPLVPISLASAAIATGTSVPVIVEIFRQAITQGILVASRGTEKADTVLMPMTEYTFLETTQLNSVNDSTIMDYLKKVFPGVAFDWCNECTGAGPGGTNVMLAYTKRDTHVTLQIPSDFEQLPVFTDGVQWDIKCMERFAGVQLHYPASAMLTILV